MRYQERVYIQNENRAVRNKDILNVNMSSDICIFKSPSFDVSGATKVQCGPITCDLSGFSSQNILDTAANECFTTQGLNGRYCFSSVTWTTKIYENNNLSYSATYYTSTSLTIDTPPDVAFFNSLTSGLTSLNYSYTLDGTILTVDKQYGSGQKDLQYDLCLTWGLQYIPPYCQAGFTATPANDACQRITTSAATLNGLGNPITTGATDSAYGLYGTFFYPTILNNGALPLYYEGTLSNLKDQSGGTITPVKIVNTGNSFWENSASNLVNGRLNQIGLTAFTSEWVGFSQCVNIPTSGTYYIGIAADNDSRFRVDGVTYVYFSGSQTDNYRKWSIFPFEFASGLHIIEMEALDAGVKASFGAEIYFPTGATPFATLTAATSTAATQANTIFTTKDRIGDYWELGTTVGYSCTGGFSLNTCDVTPVCTFIENSEISGCTGTCAQNCTTICNDTFPYIDNTSQGVYLLGSDISTLTVPLTFNFTANTDVFTANSATFKYKIYKFVKETGAFNLPPVYESRNILYSEFSGVTANTLTQSVPVSGLSVDGDYLVKGFFEADTCTDFLNRLGKRIDTTINSQGSLDQVYQPDLDYYFSASRSAETPYFIYSQINDDAVPAGGISLFQQVIIVDDTNIDVPYQSNPEEVTTPLYFRTGSTFSLSHQYDGGVVVTLNGLTLSSGLDYTLSGFTLTMLGPVTNGDIITIIYTKTSNVSITSEPIYINSAIASGTTNNQGSNKYYYNTTTGKYEIYLTNTPLQGTDIVVILNGITLTNNIDYYQSTTNSKRIILEGVIMTSDVINVIYYPSASLINGITTTNNYVTWYVDNAPQSVNGTFYVEYSTNSSFSSYNVSDTVPYVVDLENYTGLLTLTGAVGTNYYYRVKNIKDYVSICGDAISSTAYSETVRVQIQSNVINSY